MPQGSRDGNSDVVLFVGSGSTAAVCKLVQVLGLNTVLPRGTPVEDRPVVFVGPHEHHSNLLPWRESAADVVVIAEDPITGGLDLDDLTRCLVACADRRLKIGSFAAASNVTGIVEDADAVTVCLHKHGALACWDYATAAPYMPVDMNPYIAGEDRALAYKDAVFLSPHKLVGGPGAPGILIAKKRLFDNAVPSAPGGGTVFFVTDDAHRYDERRARTTL